jgi:FkbM family methyltransferase
MNYQKNKYGLSKKKINKAELKSNQSKRKQKAAGFPLMDIQDQFGNQVDTKRVETREQKLANEYIQENDVVLELGARYGSVSCIINSKLNNMTKTNQVVVEPDKRVWKALERNRDANDCKFHIVKGFISKQKLDLKNLESCNGGYGATFVDTDNTEIQSYSLDEIKNKYNLSFNVLVADCEGFLERFFDENPELYTELRMVIYEADYPNKCDYDKIKQNLANNNFKEIISGKQNVWIK